ncbi:uncharacterized protein LOC117188578 [Drosophila miranda]|uniref:uncharacterized protein LOC117188578 n=1 Tax=Drosophila miranda TaxID=7229 RepID=UPI00143F4ABC|nr:uncharacterized protein LOC117188578 [Drosophila miranda]
MTVMQTLMSPMLLFQNQNKFTNRTRQGQVTASPSPPKTPLRHNTHRAKKLRKDRKICVVYDIILCFELLFAKKGIEGRVRLVQVLDECRDACIYCQSLCSPPGDILE